MGYGGVPLDRLEGNGRRVEEMSGLGNGRKEGLMLVIREAGIVPRKEESAMRYVSLPSEILVTDR
jgi:hypothetical protein